MNERNWFDIEPENYSLSAYEVSKKVIHLLRHSQKVQREDDGAVHFWKLKNIFRVNFHKFLLHWSDEKWKSCLTTGQQEEE